MRLYLIVIMLCGLKVHSVATPEQSFFDKRMPEAIFYPQAKVSYVAHVSEFLQGYTTGNVRIGIRLVPIIWSMNHGINTMVNMCSWRQLSPLECILKGLATGISVYSMGHSIYRFLQPDSSDNTYEEPVHDRGLMGAYSWLSTMGKIGIYGMYFSDRYWKMRYGIPRDDVMQYMALPAVGWLCSMPNAWLAWQKLSHSSRNPYTAAPDVAHMLVLLGSAAEIACTLFNRKVTSRACAY